MVSFETKVALLVRDDLLAWQALTVAAFLATGIAGAAPEALGAPYEDAAGRRYVPLLGQPIMIYAATRAALLRAPPRAGARADHRRLCRGDVHDRPR
jgi:hypothetical protein